MDEKGEKIRETNNPRISKDDVTLVLTPQDVDN
jgi:hypothetical protein